jgi:hypothetical protein
MDRQEPMKIIESILVLIFYALTFLGMIFGVGAVAFLLIMILKIVDLMEDPSTFVAYDFRENVYAFLLFCILCPICIWVSKKIEDRVDVR